MVNTAEIGGAGLGVISAQQASVAPVQNERYTITVSTQGPQVLFVQDVTGQIRGLSLSLPINAQGQNSHSVLRFDAASTALGFLFLSPGVTVLEGRDPALVIAALQQLTSFAAIVAYLQSALPTQSTDIIAADPAFQNLMIAGLQEWQQKGVALVASLSSSVAKSLAFAISPDITPCCEAGLFLRADDSKGSEKLPVIIENNGWRYVRAYKVAYDRDGNYVRTDPPTDIIAGARKVSIGAFVTETLGQASVYHDEAQFQGYIARYDYWIVGPGKRICSPCPPPIEAQVSDADIGLLWLASITNYVSVPTLGLMAGLSNNTVVKAVGNVQKSYNVSVSLATLISPNSSHMDRARAAINIQWTIVSAIVNDLKVQGLIHPPLELLKFINPVNRILDAVNMEIALADLLRRPYAQKFTITGPYDILRFNEPEYIGSGGSAKITVERVGGSNDKVSVDYAVSDGSAINGADYFSTRGTLTFAPGEKIQTFTVQLLNNPDRIAPRVAQLTLSKPSAGAGLDSRNVAELLIAGTQVHFEKPVYNVAKDAGVATLHVAREGDMNGTVTVNYAMSGGTAIAGEDYVATSGVLTFAPNEAVRTIAVKVLDNTANTFLRRVNVVLSNPSGAVLGAQSTALLEIGAMGNSGTWSGTYTRFGQVTDPYNNQCLTSDTGTLTLSIIENADGLTFTGSGTITGIQAWQIDQNGQCTLDHTSTYDAIVYGSIASFPANPIGTTATLSGTLEFFGLEDLPGGGGAQVSIHSEDDFNATITNRTIMSGAWIPSGTTLGGGFDLTKQ